MINEKRFWSKVQKTEGCWLWTASLDRRGYGQFRLDGRIQKAHRVSWQLANGPIAAWSDPKTSPLVLHSCDNPRCVNPAHLSTGTNADNTADRDSKGRALYNRPPRGERHGNSRLTETQVREIRSLRGEAKGIDIATRFGITPQAVCLIQQRKAWRHVA